MMWKESSETDLISIIIPVFNVQDYLDECLDSVMKQTYSNIEVLLIDGGSKDHTFEICNRWVKKNRRIRVYEYKDGYQGACRNFGIQIANGKYIQFVDGDDKISEQMTEVLYRNMVENHADLSVCTHDAFGLAGGAMEYSGNQRLYSAKEFLQEYTQFGNKVTPAVWQRLYRTDMIKNIRFPEHIKYEDLCWSAQVLFKCKKIVYIDSPFYHYRVRVNSSTDFSESGRGNMNETVITAELSEMERLAGLLYEAGYTECADNVKVHYYLLLLGYSYVLRKEKTEIYNKYYPYLVNKILSERKWIIKNAFRVNKGGASLFIKGLSPYAYYFLRDICHI